MSDDKILRFNWQEENHNPRSFLGWMMPAIMVGNDFDAMPEGWTEAVEIEIIVNGVPVDASHMIESLEKNYDYSVLKEAERMLNERFTEPMNELYDNAYEASRDLRRAINQYVVGVGRAMGVNIYRDEELD